MDWCHGATAERILHAENGLNMEKAAPSPWHPARLSTRTGSGNLSEFSEETMDWCHGATAERILHAENGLNMEKAAPSPWHPARLSTRTGSGNRRG